MDARATNVHASVWKYGPMAPNENFSYMLETSVIYQVYGKQSCIENYKNALLLEVWLLEICVLCHLLE